MTKDVGMSTVSMDMFFDGRYARQRGSTHAIDITSESTYGNPEGWTEWGCNRDYEKLRQINWLLVTDSEGIPMRFRMLPGSVADIITLKTVADTLKEKGLGGERYVQRIGNAGKSAAHDEALLSGRPRLRTKLSAGDPNPGFSPDVTSGRGPGKTRREGPARLPPQAPLSTSEPSPPGPRALYVVGTIATFMSLGNISQDNIFRDD